MTTRKDDAVNERIRLVQRMLEYRGFEATTVSREARLYFIHGSKQKNRLHPRSKNEVLAAFPIDAEYSSSSVQRAVYSLASNAGHRKLPKGSSLTYIYSFAKTAQRLSDIQKAFQDKGNIATYHYEMIHTSVLDIDRRIFRSARKHKLVRESEFELAIGRSGKSVIIDRPLLMPEDSGIAQYLGARRGDYVEYERLTTGEVGPMWMLSVRKVSDIMKQKGLAAASEDASK